MKIRLLQPSRAKLKLGRPTQEMASFGKAPLTRPVGKYGAWVDQGRSGEGVEAEKVELRVVAIPQAGMGSWAYHGWQEKMSGKVEMLPVELPGRNTRMGERPLTSMRECVEGLVGGLPLDKPYVVLGHSLGAWMAYETCREIKKRGLREPEALIVSGARPPHLAGLEHDADSTSPSLGDLPTSEAFWEHFERRYGANPDLQSPMIRTYVEPLLRSDFRLLEAYRGLQAPANLGMPVVACCARDDDRCPPSQLEAWAAYGAPFSLKWFDVTPLPWSTPHRYLVESPDQFVAFLDQFCLDLLSGKPTPGPYRVVAPKGAILRHGISLDSPQVDAPSGLLPRGLLVNVVQLEPLPSSSPSSSGSGGGGAAGQNKKPKLRARIDHPVAGWISAHLLQKQQHPS